MEPGTNSSLLALGHQDGWELSQRLVDPRKWDNYRWLPFSELERWEVMTNWVPWSAEGTSQTAVILFKNTDGTVEESIHPVNSLGVMYGRHKWAIRSYLNTTVKWKIVVQAYVSRHGNMANKMKINTNAIKTASCDGGVGDFCVSMSSREYALA